jgi:hypothetical protein
MIMFIYSLVLIFAPAATVLFLYHLQSRKNYKQNCDEICDTCENFYEMLNDFKCINFKYLPNNLHNFYKVLEFSFYAFENLIKNSELSNKNLEELGKFQNSVNIILANLENSFDVFQTQYFQIFDNFAITKLQIVSQMLVDEQVINLYKIKIYDSINYIN